MKVFFLRLQDAPWMQELKYMQAEQIQYIRKHTKSLEELELMTQTKVIYILCNYQNYCDNTDRGTGSLTVVHVHQSVLFFVLNKAGKSKLKKRCMFMQMQSPCIKGLHLSLESFCLAELITDINDIENIGASFLSIHFPYVSYNVYTLSVAASLLPTNNHATQIY